MSNENGKVVEVYFDDFRVEHIKSPVVSSQGYYPFGVSFGKYERESSLNNQYQYNGKEQQDELNLDWLDYGARIYMSDVARWMSADYLAEKAYSLTPYRYGYNNPVRYLDPYGLYETDGHYWTVYLMGMLNGLGNVRDRNGNSAARQLANATEWPDNIMFSNGDVDHGNPTWIDPIYAQSAIHALTGRAASEERKSSALLFMAASFEELGLVAHRLGDSYAHTRMDGSGLMFDSPFGHLFEGHTPDKIAERPWLYLAYVRQLARLFSEKFGTPAPDLFTFEYIAHLGGSTEQNSAILETEIRIQEGASSFSVAGDHVSAINNYINARNSHTVGTGMSIYRNVIYTSVDVYTKDGKGGWNKKSEMRTYVSQEE